MMDWQAKLEAVLDGDFIDDLTSPGDAYFTYFIGLTAKARLGSPALTEQLRKAGQAYAIRIEIAKRAPIAAVAFCRWQGDPTALEEKDTPYTPEQAALYAALARFAKENDLALFSAAALNAKTAYALFFEAE